MKKSLFTFGLLMNSLVMLAIMPFLNQNNSFSNVLAQEYDKYGDNSYSQYPTDDKKYECRTGPFEGFFVGSVEFCKHSVEFCKHVKFDDRKDHTRDNNNQTGIQGPPVADRRNWPTWPSRFTRPSRRSGRSGRSSRRTNSQGERGLTEQQEIGPASNGPGPQGIQGERGFNGTQGIQGEREFNGTDGVNGTQGIQGPNLINSSSLYRVVGEQLSLAIDQVGTSIARCNTGDVVVSGGYLLFTDVPPISQGEQLPVQGNTPEFTGPNDSAYFTTIQTGVHR